MTDQQTITKINDATNDLEIVTRLINRGRGEEAKEYGAELWTEVFRAVGFSGNQEVLSAQMNFEKKYAVIRQGLSNI
jgi:hypothetical protein